MATFPVTGLITTFPGPSENPLSMGGTWTQLTGARPPLQKVGASVTNSQAALCYSVYTQDVFYATGDNIIEVWGCSSGGQLGAALETWRVALWQAPYYLSRGYRCYYGGGIGKGFSIARIDDPTGPANGIASAGGGYPTNLGMRIDGAAIQCWASYDNGVTYALMCEGNETTYRGNFYLGLGIEEDAIGDLGFTCFGGGIKNRTQIYRIIRGST
jgi:hypothetical protein